MCPLAGYTGCAFPWDTVPSMGSAQAPPPLRRCLHLPQPSLPPSGLPSSRGDPSSFQPLLPHPFSSPQKVQPICPGQNSMFSLTLTSRSPAFHNLCQKLGAPRCLLTLTFTAHLRVTPSSFPYISFFIHFLSSLLSPSFSEAALYTNCGCPGAGRALRGCQELLPPVPAGSSRFPPPPPGVPLTSGEGRGWRTDKMSASSEV